MRSARRASRIGIQSTSGGGSAQSGLDPDSPKVDCGVNGINLDPIRIRVRCEKALGLIVQFDFSIHLANFLSSHKREYLVLPLLRGWTFPP